MLNLIFFLLIIQTYALAYEPSTLAIRSDTKHTIFPDPKSSRPVFASEAHAQEAAKIIAAALNSSKHRKTSISAHDVRTRMPEAVQQYIAEFYPLSAHHKRALLHLVALSVPIIHTLDNNSWMDGGEKNLEEQYNTFKRYIPKDIPRFIVGYFLKDPCTFHVKNFELIRCTKYPRIRIYEDPQPIELPELKTGAAIGVVLYSDGSTQRIFDLMGDLKKVGRHVRELVCHLYETTRTRPCVVFRTAHQQALGTVAPCPVLLNEQMTRTLAALDPSWQTLLKMNYPHVFSDAKAMAAFQKQQAEYVRSNATFSMAQRRYQIDNWLRIDTSKLSWWQVSMRRDDGIYDLLLSLLCCGYGYQLKFIPCLVGGCCLMCCGCTKLNDEFHKDKLKPQGY